MTKCSSERVWALMRIRTLLTGVSLLAVMCLPTGILRITSLIIFAGGHTPSGRGLAANTQYPFWEYTGDEPRPSEGRDEGSEEPANGGQSLQNPPRRIKMNTPGKNDGILRGCLHLCLPRHRWRRHRWVDGQPAFEKIDVSPPSRGQACPCESRGMRDVNTLRIETVWLNPACRRRVGMNVYLGGSWVARSDHHLYIDNVVIAHDYIGPIQ